MATASRPITVFIAEDNPVLLQGLDRALSAHGYTVETAQDGPALLERLSATQVPPDLLLVDVMMPGMSGPEVLQAVDRDPRLAGIPAVLITAATWDSLPTSLPRDRGTEVLIKPFRLNDLLERIEAHVERHRAAASGPVPDALSM